MLRDAIQRIARLHFVGGQQQVLARVDHGAGQLISRGSAPAVARLGKRGSSYQRDKQQQAPGQAGFLATRLAPRRNRWRNCSRALRYLVRRPVSGWYGQMATPPPDLRRQVVDMQHRLSPGRALAHATDLARRSAAEAGRQRVGVTGTHARRNEGGRGPGVLLRCGGRGERRRIGRGSRLRLHEPAAPRAAGAALPCWRQAPVCEVSALGNSICGRPSQSSGRCAGGALHRATCQPDVNSVCDSRKHGDNQQRLKGLHCRLSLTNWRLVRTANGRQIAERS